MNDQRTFGVDTGSRASLQEPRHAAGSGGEGALAGFALLFEGFRWLCRERSLWALAVIPLGFSILAVGIALTLVFVYASELYGVITQGLMQVWPVAEVDAWYQWLWLGPVKLFFWLLSWLVFALSATLALILGLLLANLAAAPFLDALSWRVERLFHGNVIEPESAGLAGLMRDVGRSLSSEAQRTVFFLIIWVVLIGIGFVIPGAHLVTGPLMIGITIVFLPLEFSGYVLDRRQVPFRERRRWIQSDWPRMLGFGSAAFLACLVPVVNLAIVPVLVVAGTLLALRGPPDAELR